MKALEIGAMKISLRISPHWGTDFRPLAAYVNRDSLIEKAWRARVARNPKEIARLIKECKA